MVDRRVPPPERLSEEERKQIGAWCHHRYRHLYKRLPELWDDCRDYYIMRGEAGYQIQNGGWAACFRRWVRNEAEPRRMDRHRESMPYEPRPKVEGSNPKSVFEILKGGKKDGGTGN